MRFTIPIQGLRDQSSVTQLESALKKDERLSMVQVNYANEELSFELSTASVFKEISKNSYEFSV